MQTKTTGKTLVIFSVFLLLAGCANTRNSKPRTASDLFLETTEAFIGMFETDEIGEWDEIEEWRNRNHDAKERREKWQCENLSDSELQQLGINK